MAFEGIRVLDWAQFQQGPVSTMLLADLGADVIKIEDRVVGDRGRGVIRVGGSNVAESLTQRNPHSEIGNRNKRSITLDLKREKGKGIIYNVPFSFG